MNPGVQQTSKAMPAIDKVAGESETPDFTLLAREIMRTMRAKAVVLTIIDSAVGSGCGCAGHVTELEEAAIYMRKSATQLLKDAKKARSHFKRHPDEPLETGCTL